MNALDLTQSEAYVICSEFVAKTCKDRNISHGYNHMKRVVDLSIKIINLSDFNLTDHEKQIIIICAWLHDVNDHKYSYENNEEKLNEFLFVNFTDDRSLIINIIDRVSFSREKQYGMVDWLYMLGNRGVLMRNIVSDADKIDAIDILRCKSYGDEIYSHATQKQIYNDVVAHCEYKLLRLKNEFLRTDIGKIIAKPYHKKLIKDYNAMRRLC